MSKGLRSINRYIGYSDNNGREITQAINFLDANGYLEAADFIMSAWEALPHIIAERKANDLQRQELESRLEWLHDDSPAVQSQGDF
jgi:hypothetical protein